MTTWGQLRDKVVRLLAEYRNGVAEADGNATHAVETIYATMTTVYRELVARVARGHAEQIADIMEFTYDANEEYVDLATVDVDVDLTQVVALLSLMTIENGKPGCPLVEITARQYRAYVAGGDIAALDESLSDYAYFVQKNRLYVLPMPTRALTLRASYVAAVADLDDGTDAGNSPDLIPAQHHDLIAYLTADGLRGETDQLSRMQRDILSSKQREFNLWADGAGRAGTRFVR